MAPTPAIATAERAGIHFSLHEYEHDPGAASYGLEAAEKLGVEPARVFKTLVASIDGASPWPACPVAAELDLKALGKRAQMADKTQAERATGYVSGGISPLGQRRRLPTRGRLGARARDDLRQRRRRGLQIELDPNDLVRLTDASVSPLATRLR
jgi:Uncharacterized conserved protein